MTVDIAHREASAAGIVDDALHLPIRTIAVAIWTAIGVVVAAGIFREAVNALDPVLGARLKFIDLNGEASVPAWFASALMLGAVFLLLVQHHRSRAARSPDTAAWLLLAVGFLLMSLDESAGFHERVSQALINWLKPGGIFAYAWVIVAIPLVAGLAVVFLPFLRRLPPQSRNRMVLAGAVFLAGAIGMEMVGAYFFDRTPPNLLMLSVAIVLEESLEFSGLCLFIIALLRHLADGGRDIRLHLSQSRR
jgi:hypothetical protein